MSKIKLGKYKHFKGKIYEVIGVGKHSETLEDLVVYKALSEGEFPMGTIWIRPIDMFLGIKNVDGKEVKRFEYIGEE